MLFFVKKQKKKEIEIIKFKAKHFFIKLYKIVVLLIFLSVAILLFLLKINENLRAKAKDYYFKNFEKKIARVCFNTNINGIKNSNKDTVEFHIDRYCSPNEEMNRYYTLENLKDDILKDPWINHVHVKRKFPYTLNVEIIEYRPFAIWQKKDKFHLIDEGGVIINISNQEIKRFYNLLTVAGNDSKENISALFNVVLSNPELATRIKIARRIGNRRWDLIFENGVLAKLPEKNLPKSWEDLGKIFSISGSEIGLVSVDLRVSDKIFLEYEKSVFRKMKQLGSN